MGKIQDWTPTYYSPNKVTVPYFVPDTEIARADIAAQYTAVNRMDQGIQLILQELKESNLLDNTLILYTSDNGRTNLYDPGMKEPLIVSSPEHRGSWKKRTSAMSSLHDITPTVLDWFHIPYPIYTIFKHRNPARLSGRSLLPLLSSRISEERNERRTRKTVFSSHSFHEITMYYPQRVARTGKYKLIHNLNFKMPFPIDQDFYLSPTFRELLNRTATGLPTMWYKTINGYYYREEFELYDIIRDPEETKNLALAPKYRRQMEKLKQKLHKWMTSTDDPWICSPSGVYENKGAFMHQPQCMPLYNET